MNGDGFFDGAGFGLERGADARWMKEARSAWRPSYSSCIYIWKIFTDGAGRVMVIGNRYDQEESLVSMLFKM